MYAGIVVMCVDCVLHYRKTLFLRRYFYIRRYRLTDDFNIHSSVSPAQLTNISCAELTWLYHVYSSITDESTVYIHQ
jgi:hypothetical protein